MRYKTNKIIPIVMAMAILAGCGKQEAVQEIAPSEVTENIAIEATETAEPSDAATQEAATADTTEENVIQGSGNERTGLSDKEIVNLARKRSGAPKAELDHVLEDGKLVIHLYEKLEDDDIATWDWYTIDPETLSGTNFDGDEVNLVNEVNSKISDGNYYTDDKTTGIISDDHKLITLNTMLVACDNNWKILRSYEREEHKFEISDTCTCRIVTETEDEYPFNEKIDVLQEYLSEPHGLPVGITVKNGKVNRIILVMESALSRTYQTEDADEADETVADDMAETEEATEENTQEQ